MENYPFIASLTVIAAAIWLGMEFIERKRSKAQIRDLRSKIIYSYELMTQLQKSKAVVREEVKFPQETLQTS